MCSKSTIRILIIAFGTVLILSYCNFPGMESENNSTSIENSPSRTETQTPEESHTDTPSGIDSGASSSQSPNATASPTFNSTGSNIPAMVQPEPATIMIWIDGSFVVYVPEGSYQMGNSDPALDMDDDPQHEVHLDGYWIYRNEVSNRLYAKCVAAGACSEPEPQPETPYWYDEPQYLDDPVVGVDWNQAAEYCEWAQARLPTEAEWEKAARGSDSLPYPWGSAQPECDLLNFNNCITPTPMPEMVGSYPEGDSPYHADDMAGNVYEWIRDWYAADYYEVSPESNPPGPDEGEEKVIRSSGFSTTPDQVHVALRFHAEREETRANLGFRCVPTGLDNPPPPVCVVPPDSPGQECEPLEPSEIEFEISDLSCRRLDSTKETNAYIIFSDELRNSSNYSVSVNDVEFSCSIAVGFPNRLVCTGPDFPRNTLAELKICVPITYGGGCPTPDPNEYECPTGYRYSEEQQQCLFEEFSFAPPECPEGYAEFQGGCAPIPENGTCPAGYFFYAEEELCLRGGEFPPCMPGYVYSEELQRCEESEDNCPVGYELNTETGCCQFEEEDGFNDNLYCPIETFYDEEIGQCVPSVPEEQQCVTVDYSIYPCPTETPVPVIPDEPADPCSAYNNQPDRCASAEGCVFLNDGLCVGE